MSQRRRAHAGEFRRHLERLRNASPDLFGLLADGPSLEVTRDRIFTYLERRERRLLGADMEVHFLERANIQESIRVLKSVFAPINEKRTGASALEILWKLASGDGSGLRGKVSPGFLLEFVFLFRGAEGKSGIYRDSRTGAWRIPKFLRLKARKAAQKRSDILDRIAGDMGLQTRRYPSGLEPEVVTRRIRNRRRILAYFGGTESDWRDWEWHLSHVIKNVDPILDLIEITPEQREAVEKAGEHRVPFGITPYYLHLMDPSPMGVDHAVRAQVLPPPDYVNALSDHEADRDLAFDFMGEHDTSPVDLVTRRYPRIAILKPYNTCAQICVYCQRNWEIDECMAPNALASEETLDRAARWFADHPAVGDVLVTGGDPGVMRDHFLERLLGRLAELPHIYRIRFATRTPVVLPQRWTDGLTGVLSALHEPGRREIAVVTHFEHSYEITPEARDAVARIRKAGISVYNQQVFTMDNSRRFESAKLRLDLKSIGVDPYYMFNMKGKEEMRMYRVPIARLLQERKEEARLLPGLDRTDEPVFNVPRLGKNHLRAGQDHQLVMIRPDGRRVYEFHPWEKKLALVPTYLHTDVSIFEYLQALKARGEDVSDYRSIWYYY